MPSWEPTRHNNGEGRRCWSTERKAISGPAGVVATARADTFRDATREVCSGEHRVTPGAQQGACEGRRWPGQMADGLVVLSMPGNAGGGKEP